MRSLSPLLASLLLAAGCSSASPTPAPVRSEEAAAEPTPPPPAPTPTPSTPPPPAESAREAHAPSVDPVRARAIVTELRALRRLVHEHRIAEAAPRFLALARSEPGNPRLHCEAGFVAQQSGDPTNAARELDAGLRLFEHMTPLPEAMRVPRAMCLYNRGLLAEEELDGAYAVVLYEASLALRPNATVERHLRAAEALPAGDLPEFPPLGEVTRGETVRGGERRAVLVTTHFADAPAEMETGCFDVAIELADPIAGSTEAPLVGACDEVSSIFRDWADASTPRFFDAGAPLGWVATVEVSRGGRGDSESGTQIEVSDAVTLHVFAVVDGRWVSGSTPIEESAMSDCENDFCDDPESTEDDAEDLPAPYENAYRFDWSVRGSDLVFTQTHRTGEIEVPALGTVPIARFAHEPL